MGFLGKKKTSGFWDWCCSHSKIRVPVSGRYIMHTVGMFGSGYARCVGCGGWGWIRGGVGKSRRGMYGGCGWVLRFDKKE